MSLFRKTNKQELDCATVCDMMFDYLDGQLSADKSDLLTRHIAECDECQSELEQRKATLNLIQNVDYSIPEELYPNVMSLIGTTSQDKKKILFNKKVFAGQKYNRNRFIHFGGLVAACAVVIIALYNLGGMPDAGMADLAFTKSAAHDEMYETDGEIFIYGTDGFFDKSIESVSDVNIDDNEPDEKIYAGSHSVMTLAPPILDKECTNNSAGSTKSLLSVYLSCLKETHTDSAIIVCESDELDEILKDDVADNSDNSNSDSSLFAFSNDTAIAASDEFNGYVSLLKSNGDTFETYIPEGESFTTYYILILNSDSTE